MHSISPAHVLWQIARSLPEEVRESVIVVGSLAAGFCFFEDDAEGQLRTKDADCLIATGKAVVIAQDITEHLFASDWQLRTDGDFGTPGDAQTPEERLPVVRVFPPNEKEWFLELLSGPTNGTASKGREFTRLVTSQGHFALCAFRFFALLEYRPRGTKLGLRIARPEMMALSNLLHHPAISPILINGETSGPKIKRSNKDLGRVLALAFLSTERDADILLGWPELWRDALAEKFPEEVSALLMRAGNGIRALLASEADLIEAHSTASVGLLASKSVGLDAFRMTGERMIMDVFENAERMAQAGRPFEERTPDSGGGLAPCRKCGFPAGADWLDGGATCPQCKLVQ